jgi:hypothetical protein
MCTLHNPHRVYVYDEAILASLKEKFSEYSHERLIQMLIEQKVSGKQNQEILQKTLAETHN